MKAPRSVVHAVEGNAREFLSVAVRIAAATGGKDGFSVQLFPDLRPPQTIYVTPTQMEKILGLAESDASETEIWAELAKIPLEPLLPARSLYPRLRQLLVDQHHALRDELAVIQRRAEARLQAQAAVQPTIDLDPTMNAMDPK